MSLYKGAGEGEPEAIIYRGYHSHSVAEAIAAYRKRIGEEPTLAIARPELELTDTSPILVRSDFGAASCLLLTHLQTPATFHWHVQPERTEKMVPAKVGTSIKTEPNDDKAIVEKNSRRDRGDCSCPTCSQRVRDFNKLGFWWGWAEGIQPPYWEELKAYVFNRDGHICQKCHLRFGGSALVAHHIRPKEARGTDSARNLTTLCHRCHDDGKPIMSDEDEHQ